MEVLILGTGGFGNPGLPFNSYLIGGHVLVDCPPDILQSLGRAGIPLEAIDVLVLSHFHGDHYFGLPFFLFNLRNRLESLPPGDSRRAHPLRIIAPQGIDEKIAAILGLAISPDHPYIEWALSAVERDEIRPGREGRISIPGGLWLEFAVSDHSVTTFSVLAGVDGEEEARFIGTSDTRWSASTEALLRRPARLYLCDANGKEPGGVHASPVELVGKGMSLVQPGSILLGTHLSEIPVAGGTLRFALPGDRFGI